MASRGTSCILFEFTYIYVETSDSLCRLQIHWHLLHSPRRNVFVAFEIHSAIGYDFMNNLQHGYASRAHSLQATSSFIRKFAETECRHFDKLFNTDCTGRQLPVQPVMEMSSKWYFRFSARASWIILTFCTDPVHVYMTFCGHVYSYKIQYTSSM